MSHAAVDQRPPRSRPGSHFSSGGKGRLSSSRRRTLSMPGLSMLSSRAHARLGLRERGGHRATAHAEQARDLFLIKPEVVLRDDHRALAFSQHCEQPRHFHAVKRFGDLVTSIRHENPSERDKRRAIRAATRAPKSYTEQPAGEVLVGRGRSANALKEGVM